MDIRELAKYIESQRYEGVSDEDIQNNLLVNGFSRNDIQNIFNQLKKGNQRVGLDILRPTKKYFLRGDYNFQVVENGLSKKDTNTKKLSGLVPGSIGIVCIFFSFMNFNNSGMFILALVSLICGFLAYHLGEETLGNIIFAASFCIALSAPLIWFFAMLLGFG